MKTTTRKSYFQNIMSLIFASVVICTGLQSWAQEETDPLIASGHIQPAQLEASQTAELLLFLELPEGFHAYEDKFRFEILSPSDFKIGGFNISPLTEFFDPVTKKQKRGVEKKSELRAAIEFPSSISGGSHELEVKLWYQACTTN
ncbi:MAG: protein-disulfide reductase DsbD domain-containing protein, partial [Pseudobdellovibrionaceae bacterium]